MLAALITFPHFSVLSAMSFPNSVGDVGNAVAPRSDHWTCKRRVDFLVELANDVGGVFLGAARPNQAAAS